MKKKSQIPAELDVNSKDLKHYYHDFRYELFIKRPRDKDGIPLWEYGTPIGNRYYPILVTAYGLALHEQYLHTANEKTLAEFLKVADFLVRTQTEKVGGWEYEIPNLRYYVAAPWISGMSQGLGISLLLRAHQLTGVLAYVDAASRAVRAFQLSTRDGGVRDVTSDGFVFYEEYPSSCPTGSSHILNGFLFSLWGLYDYYRAQESNDALRFFEEGICTLERFLPLYDCGFWSRYSLNYPMYLADSFYHKLHVDGLRVLYRISQKGVFKEYADRWDAYQKNPSTRLVAFLAFYFFRVKYKTQRCQTLLKLS